MRKEARKSTIPLLVLLLSCTVMLAGCANLPATTMYPYGDHATRILDLLMPVFWMAVGVFVVVQGALVYTVIRFRSKQANAPVPTQIHGNTNIEIMWTIAPAIILLVIAVMTFRTQAANSYQPPEAMKIRAISHQWWFEFQYDDGKIVTASDLYIPVGQSVQIQLDAADVMHNFWIPKLAGKTYMIPGKTNYLAFKATEAGIFRAFCAEFCGESHGNMRFRVIALDPAEFAQWKTNYATTPAATNGTAQALGLTGDAARGAAIFADPKKQCAACHIIEGTTAKGKIGPNLTHYGNRLTIAAGVLPYTTDNLANWLHDPAGIKPGNLMGRVIKKGTLKDQEVADLVAYLDGMKFAVNLPAEK